MISARTYTGNASIIKGSDSRCCRNICRFRINDSVHPAIFIIKIYTTLWRDASKALGNEKLFTAAQITLDNACNFVKQLFHRKWTVKITILSFHRRSFYPIKSSFFFKSVYNIIYTLFSINILDSYQIGLKYSNKIKKKMQFKYLNLYHICKKLEKLKSLNYVIMSNSIVSVDISASTSSVC